MQQQKDGSFLYSPTDLVTFLECSHTTFLAATWAAIALFSVPIGTVNVLAHDVDTPAPIEQAIQERTPNSKEPQVSFRMPLYDALNKVNHIQLKVLLK